MERSINGGDLRGNERVEILKPRIDKREFRRIVLSNSLEVLLISDPDTDKCAASMGVRVGSFSDPEGLEGLAHFLEHMLFYASEKYPQEDSYSKYIAEHGGYTNAFTDDEHTNFHFDVMTEYFEEALDRFAQFFVKPLMSPDATMREINAVDSEHQKNLLTDYCRMDQLERHLSARDHPYHKFGCGNLSTLAVGPKSRGLDTRDELLKFYEKFYSANLMHLVVYGRDCLDDIQKLVEEKFLAVRNTERSCSIFRGHPCASEHLQILVRAVPVKEGHKLRIVWPVTPDIWHYKEGPCMYLSHLIGHEAEGSLFFLLKKFGWATSLYAGEGNWTNEYSFFVVSIHLTDAGQEHMEDIVGLLFKYINLLKECGVERWIFDEICAIGETMFHFQDKFPPIHHVVAIACNMLFYPPQDWLAASSLLSVFNPDSIRGILEELTPKNVRIFWESKKFDACTNMTELWYGTAYTVEKISDILIQRWIDGAPNDKLSLPAPNMFIPTDLSLKNGLEKAKYPVLLRKSSFSRLWFKADTMFFSPKAFVKIDFNCPESAHSPEARVFKAIFTRLIVDYLNEYGKPIELFGYNHKMRLLLDAIIEKIVQFEVKQDRFSVIKENVTKDYQNTKFEQPYEQGMYYSSLIMEDQSWPWNEELEVLPHLKAEDLSKFVPRLLSRAFFECYVAGNVTPDEAQALVQDVEDVLFNGSQSLCKPLFPSQHLTDRIINLEAGVNQFYPIQVLNEQDENSALLYYIQVGRDDFKLNVKLQLFVLIAKQPAFHQLRSVEQLGYITFLMKRNDSGIQGVQIIIQSIVKDPEKLDERVEAFLKMFETQLYTMSNDDFIRNKNSLIDMKLEKHKNLSEESEFFWIEIERGTLKFDRVEHEVGAIRELTQEDMIDFFDIYIKVGAPRRKKLSIQVYGKLHSSEYEAAKQKENSCGSKCINDIFSFRRSQPLYGSLK
ncbi:hypothetical protein AMTRI_Chr03g140060 [Amborella trichopoda]